MYLPERALLNKIQKQRKKCDRNDYRHDIFNYQLCIIIFIHVFFKHGKFVIVFSFVFPISDLIL